MSVFSHAISLLDDNFTPEKCVIFEHSRTEMKAFNGQVCEAFQTAREENVHLNDTGRRSPANNDSQFKQTGPINIWQVKNSKSFNIKLSYFLGHTEQIRKQMAHSLGKGSTPF